MVAWHPMRMRGPGQALDKPNGLFFSQIGLPANAGPPKRKAADEKRPNGLQLQEELAFSLRKSLIFLQLS